MNNPSAPPYTHRDLPLLLAIAIVSFGAGAFLIFFAFTDRGSPGHLPPFNGLAAELAFSEDERGEELPNPNRDPHSHADEFRFHRGEEYVMAILTLRFEAIKTQLDPDFHFYLYPPWPAPPHQFRAYGEIYKPGTTGDRIAYPLRMPDGWHTGLWRVEVYAEDVWIAGGTFYTD